MGLIDDKEIKDLINLGYMLHRRINHFLRDVPRNEMMKNTRDSELPCLKPSWLNFRQYSLPDDFPPFISHLCYIFANLIWHVFRLTTLLASVAYSWLRVDLD